MSIYMTKDGKYFKIGGYLEQRYYPRYFDLEHEYEGEQELYVVKEDTTDYYKVFNEMTVYQFRITETNTTETPKIRLRIGNVNRDIPLADVTFDENHRTVEIGSLLGVYQMYTLPNLEAMCYMETVSSGNLVAGVSAHKLNSDEEPTVENTGTTYQAHFEFGIPQGKQGIQGIQGEWGDGFYLVDPTVVFTFNETVSRSNILPKLPTQFRKDEILVFADGTVGKVLTHEEDTVTLEKLPMSFQAQLTPASVTEEILADGAVTSDKIKDGTIIDFDVADNANIAQSKIAGLVTKLAALDKKDEDLSGDINNLNTNLDTLQETVTTNETDIENKVTKLTETVNTNEKDIEGKVTKLTETVNANKTELDTNIADLTDTVTANETDIEGKVTKLTETVNANETDIEDKVTKLTATVNTNETDIEGKVKSLSDTVNNKVTGLATEAYVNNKVTGLATEAYVNNKVTGLVNSAPETLDTLNELAVALGNNPNFATDVLQQIGTKANSTELATVNQTATSAKTIAEGKYTKPNSGIPATDLASIPATKITGLANVATTGLYKDLIDKPTIPTSLPPSGSAGGALSGTYPNPTLSKDIMDKINNAGTKIDWANVNGSGNYPAASNSGIALGYNSIASGNYSTALGDSSKSSGSNSMALGTSSNASGLYSTALGYNSSASYVGSTALGAGSNAFGNYSVALGRSSSASGNYSTALGYNSIASGNYSTALGYGSKSSGSYSVALGSSSNTSGNYSTALGYQSNAFGDYSVALGRSSSASGGNSTALGYQSNASGYYSTALGHNSNSFGNYSMALGVWSKASGINSIALGRSSEAYVGSTALGAGSNAFGNYSMALGRSSIASGNYSTALGDSSKSSGSNSMALGTSSNASGLYSTALGYNSSASYVGSTALGAGSNAFGNYSVALGRSSSASGNYSTAIGYFANVPNTVNNAIYLGDPNLKQIVSAVTTITALSDERTKEDITLANTTQCLVDIMRLPVKRFKFKKFARENPKDVHVTNFIAQDAQKVFPKSILTYDEEFPVLDENGDHVMIDEVDDDGNIVYEDDGVTPRKIEKKFMLKDVLHMDTSFAVPTMWGAIQELTKRFSNLEERLMNLENRFI